MKRPIPMIIAGTRRLLAEACEYLTAEQRTFVGATGGAAAGILDADNDWRLISAFAGAATQQCAYARGDDTYIVAACP